MGLSYCIEYCVLIHGKREGLLKIRNVLPKIHQEFVDREIEYCRKYNPNFEKRAVDILNYFLDHIDNSFKNELDRVDKEKKEENTIRIVHTSGDDCHTVFAQYLQAIQEIADFAIAAYLDIDGDEYRTEGYVYTNGTKKENQIFFGDNEKYSDLEIQEELQNGSIFPKDAVWIPIIWKNHLDLRTIYGFSEDAFWNEGFEEEEEGEEND